MMRPLKETVEKSVIPLESTIYQKKQLFLTKFNFLVTPKDSDDQLSLLKEENLRLLNTRVQLDSCVKENADMRRLLGAPLPGDWLFYPAKIIGRVKNDLILDKGKRDRVEKEMIVIIDNILVGKVFEVSERQSRVKTLFDPDLKIPVNVKSLSDQGNIAKGLVFSPLGKIRLGRVLMEEKINVGDLVVTLGDGGYPADLLVGKITKIERKESAIFQEAELDYLSDIDKLNNVFLVVIK